MKRLSGWDAMLLYSETPNVHMHTIKAGVIDVGGVNGTLDLKAFRSTLHGRLYKLDPLRYRLVDIPLKFHHPMWRENCEVDLEYHVRPLELPSPGGRREFDDAIGEIASTPLDRSRPLWVMYFVEGLAGGQVGVITKVHHALADGVASANLMARAMDVLDPPESDRDLYETDPAPSSSELMGAAFRDHLRQIGRLPGVLKYTADGVGRVRRSPRRLSPSLTRPFTPPQTFINHVITPERRFATASLALADVKEACRQLGVTINDLVLAMSAGALRQLLLKYDGKAEHPLLVSVPVSLDRDVNRVSGNKFTGILVALPTHVCYPLERVEQVHLAAESAKESHHLLGPELVARWSSYLPPAPAEAIFGRAARSERPSKVLNLTVSNVAGPRERGRVAGAVVREIYSVGPLTAGSGMNITVWSYVDQLNISVLTDGATLDDPHEVTDAMVCDLAEIRRAAGLSDTLTQLDTVMPPATVMR
ncbi:wax ester/triacylglycerol synthase family O-acyltransferase [Mycobacterium sp.]|uniref:WS/DGAT/MGAT family O-acyltransferase n=1 Tax=Mycobacterium sp. TaxID=1785 RepID=UPI002B8C1BB3|nr:wax ester/triacylglycerol synthase family O-acyltransferase [Mycobacterium sp.]HME50045.1 wax ester/triacylglycerol synthase family O-acyltransferase [Mycobacterium sp.]